MDTNINLLDLSVSVLQEQLEDLGEP
ncbi:uncharacterized protein METZ01_LOCUS306194, partial [marine metagenome]